MRNSTPTSALLLGLGLLSGCGGAPRALGSLDGLRAGTTTLRVVNHVSAPGELDRVTIAVDGEPVPLSSIPPSGGDAATVASLGLAPGAHSITVRARAHAAGGDVIVVGAHQPFFVQRGPAAITVDVRSGVPGSAAGAPVAVSLAMLGGRMAPDFGVGPSDDKEQRCAAKLPIPRALCRAAVDLDEASRRSDIVAALCVRDKLTEMRQLAIIGDSGVGPGVALAEAQVAQLAHAVDLCGGGVATAPAPDGVTVTRIGVR